MDAEVKGQNTSTAKDVTPRKKAVFAGALGQGLEVFDFSIYGYMAAIIASLFFPEDAPRAALLLTFSAYATGFVARPLGAVVLGSIGDRSGRRVALAAVIIIMALATFAIGILPTYPAIGIAAPILLFLARFAQGFASGGEYASSSAFIIEYAPDEKRGFYGSWQQFSVACGVLAASIVAALVTGVFPEDAVNAWAWRLPFLFAIIPGLWGIYLRLKVADSPVFTEAAESNQTTETPIRDALRDHLGAILTVTGFTMLWTVAYLSVFAYTVTYATVEIGYDLNVALIGNTLGLSLMLPLVPIMGALSDRIGRRPLLIAGAVGFVLLTYPAYVLIGQGTLLSLIAAQGILAIILATFSGPAPAALAEMFPTRVRVAALSVGYNAALVLFGGTTPFIQTYLIDLTNGNRLAPTWWVILAAVVTLIVILTRMRETVGESLR